MSSIICFSYAESSIEQISEWGFGTNWPIVYIIYNDTTAYVGETLDAVRRTRQHLLEDEFNGFTKICFISNMTFNKSVILDLEAFLIKYMSADGTKKLKNGNAGVLDHNYFYKEAYVDDFKEIWVGLIQIGIVQKSLIDIENSELFKYSPYKTLNVEQQKAAFEILRRLNQINDATVNSIITVSGGAGTGKTILAVYLVKLLNDIIHNKKVWNAIENPEDALFLQRISKNFGGIKKIGFVVPMNELRTTMKAIFSSIEGLSESMVLSPEDVVNSRYDVLVVDEAHRLYRRKNLPGGIVNKFDSINRALMGGSFTQTEKDFTQLDWIIMSSRIQVLFYDEYQAIRITDIGQERFTQICRPHLFKYVELFSQMRCKGGNGYYEYVRNVLEQSNLDIRKYRNIPNYDLKVFDNAKELISIIREKGEHSNLCKVVTGPGWSKNDEIIIDGQEYCWATGKNDTREKALFSIHKIQGFDLNYAGVIFGKEVFYDEETKRIEINKRELRDNRTKNNRDDSGGDNMRRFVLNIYITLMTRGINGTYVYAVDEKLRDYLRKFFG